MVYDGHHGIRPDECVVPILDGEQLLVFPSTENRAEGCDYVRFVRKYDLKELVYYDEAEWREHSVEVMGAIMSCIQNGAGECI